MTKLLPIRFMISTKVEVYSCDFKCVNRAKNTLQSINMNGSMVYKIIIEFFNFEKKIEQI